MSCTYIKCRASHVHLKGTTEGSRPADVVEEAYVCVCVCVYIFEYLTFWE